VDPGSCLEEAGSSWCKNVVNESAPLVVLAGNQRQPLLHMFLFREAILFTLQAPPCWAPSWGYYSPPFRAYCVQKLLQLSAETTNGSLLASIVTAYAQSLEHSYLLALLQPESQAPEGFQAMSEPASPAADSSSPAAEVARPGWRFGETDGYQVLPKARAKAGVLQQAHAVSKGACLLHLSWQLGNNPLYSSGEPAPDACS
jgi:hypothetical protein